MMPPEGRPEALDEVHWDNEWSDAVLAGENTLDNGDVLIE